MNRLPFLRRRLVLRCSGLLLFLILGGFAEAHAESVDPDRVRSGTLLLQMASGYRAATAVSTDVDMRINGLVARVSVSQRFENTGTEWAEGIYAFPLPDKAAVDRLRLHIGERYIEGEIREKDEARREYEQARREGKKTSLVEQERPNLFTTSVANIAPGETVIVEIEYLETLRYTDGMFGLRFPLTVTPRYMPGQALNDRQGSGWSADTTQVPDASRISPPVVPTAVAGSATLRISLDAGVPLDVIASRYHPVDVREQDGRYDVTLRGDTIPMDHDFELAWRPVASAAPTALVFEEASDGGRHYLLMIMPSAISGNDADPTPREQIFIIDTSGSMHGTSIEQAKSALQRALVRLRQGDRFNVIAFNSTPTAFFPASVYATPRNLRLAGSFVASLVANGGTEMQSALEVALAKPPVESHLRQLIFITDGAVGNEDALFRLIGDRLGSGRLFTVGIGSAPNGWFMRKAAETGRGSYTMISAQREVGEKMDRLFGRIERPQVTDIRLDWPGGAIVDAYPGVVPDLYASEPVAVSVRIEGLPVPGASLTVSGNTPAGVWRTDVSLDTGHRSPGVAALWARDRIGELGDAIRTDPGNQSLRAAVVETALAHHLVSRYTSLVAVDRTPARAAGDALRSDAVPNALPHGQHTNAIFGFPDTATDAGQRLVRGALLLTLALLLIGANRCLRNTADVASA